MLKILIKILFKKVLSLSIIYCLLVHPQDLKADTDITSDTTVTTLASGGYNIQSSNTLTINNSSSITYSDLIRGSGSIVLSGSGALNFSEEMTYTGNTTLEGSANLYILTDGGLPDSSAITMGTSYGDNTSITFDVSDTIGSLSGSVDGADAAISLSYSDTILTISPNSGSTTFTGSISGMGGVAKAGAGTQTLSGQLSQGTLSVSAGTLIITNSSNNYSTTSISGGTLQSGDDSATGTGKITMTGGQLSSNGTSARTFTNDLDISGSIELGDSTNNGSITIAGTTTLLGNTTLTNNSSVSLSLTDVSNSYSLTKSGSGTLTLSGANTYDGGTTITAGTLEIDNNSSLGTGAVTMTGGQLSSNGSSARSLSNTLNLNGTMEIGDSTNTGVITLGSTSITGASTLTTSSNVTLGAVSGNFGFTKTGSGTLTVNSMTGSGGTTISGGTLIALSTGSSPNINGTFERTGTTTINNGGTLQIRGAMQGAAMPSNPTWNSNIVINSGGQLRLFYDGDNDISTSIIMSASNTITGSGEIYFEEIGTMFYRNNSDQTLSVNLTKDSGFTQGGLDLLGTGTITYDGTVTAVLRVVNGTLKPGTNFDATGGTIVVSPNNTSLGNTSPIFDIDGKDVTIETLKIESQSGTGTPSIVDSNATAGSITFTTLEDDAGDTTTSDTIISAKLTGTGTIKPRLSSTYSTKITSNSSGFTGDIDFSGDTRNLEITGNGSIGSQIIDVYDGQPLEGTLTIDAGALAHSSPIIKLGADDTLNIKGDEEFTLVNLFQSGDSEVINITLDDNVTASINIPSSYTDSEYSSPTDLTANDVFNSVNLTGGANSRIKLVGSGTIDFDSFADVTGSGGPSYSGDIEVAGATLTFSNNDEIHNNSDVIVSSGTLNFGTSTDTINSLTISGGTATGSSGTTTITNAMTVSGGTVSGKTFSAGSYALSGGTISAVLAGSGDVTVSGDTTLNATNTFSGSVTVNSGATLRSDNGRGLGDTSGTTTVASGGSLHLYSASGTKSYGEDITISGTGISSSGALQVTGSNSLTGTITLGANSIIKSNTGASFTLASAGSIDGSSGDYDLTLTGAGDFTLQGDTNLGDGGLTISSTGSVSITGTLTLGSYATTSVATINNNITTSSTQSYLAGADIGGTDNQNVTLTASSVTFGTRVSALGSDINLTVTGNMTTTGDFQSAPSATFGTLSVSGTSAIGADITTNSTQTYTGAVTLSANSTMTTDNSNIIFGSTLNSASSTARRLAPNVGTGVVQFSGEVGATQALGLIDITGGLDLDANITGAAGLTVSSTSNLGANVTTSGNQTYTGRATLSSNVTLAGLNVNFGGQIIGGSNALTVTGNFDLDGAASGITNLSVSGLSNLGANVTTTGTQTYTGGSTLSAATTLEGSTVNLNAVTGGSNALTITGNLDLDGDITGVTNLSVSGTTNIGGDVATTNNQTYTGLTTVSASKTLSGAAITASVVNLGSNDLGISNTAASSITGVVSGTGGSLTKLGSGTLTLSNANTYTGDTTIDAGTLTVTGTLSDSTDVIVASGATYDVDENDTVKSVTGTGTTNIASSKTLILSSSDTGSSSTVFEGSGNLTKAGTGTLTVLGESTISGDVTVSGGVLYAGNASSSTDTIFSNNVTVDGGTLGGGGIIGGNVTVTNGSLTPGNSIGTLNIDGDLDLTTNSTVTIEFNASNSDKIVVNGDINLAGAIRLDAANATYAAKTYILIDGSNGVGNSLNGTFATETVVTSGNLNGATASIVYDITNNIVKLDLTASTVTASVKSNTSVNSLKTIADIFDNSTASTLSSLKTYWVSNTSVVDSELKEAKGTVLATSLVQAQKTHNAFQKAVSNVTSMGVSSPVGNFTRSGGSNLSLAELQESGLFGDRLKWSEHYDYSDTSVLGFLKNNKNKTLLSGLTSDDRAAFIRTYGANTKRNNIGSDYTGYQNDTYGILFGEQYKMSEGNFNGYSYGLSGSDTDYNDSYGESRTYSAHSSIFKQIDEKDHAVNLIAGGYLSHTSSKRNVSVGEGIVNDTYKSTTNDFGVNASAQYTKKLNFGGWQMSPSISLQGSYEFKDDIKESGGDLALNVKNDNLITLKPELGFSLDRNFSDKPDIINQFNFSTFVSQDHYIDGTTSSAKYTSDNSAFNMNAPKDHEKYVSVGLGYNFIDKKNDSNLIANIFHTESTDNDLKSNVFSVTYRKLFGGFGKGKIPPVIASSPNKEEDKGLISKTIDKVTNALVYQKPLCRSGQVYKNNKCIASEATLQLVAAKLHQIQKVEPSLGLIALRYYVEFTKFIPLITFVMFIILIYEIIRMLAVKLYKRRYY